ncbi:MAG: tRNA (adenosine(37)-N6)-threonylcarbamoyltransferase complex ATPase subunit type 1 TsaE [Eudoraea sp.]|nr:tRNA (adenosine(37)-N6)-threonylcarbamoyltransferase complex ATPase subunit type 1 TsaE [Eudoraea sp.]
MSNIIYNLSQIENVVDYILLNTGSKLLCFHGDLGAGKTTLIKALVKKLGGTDTGSSPTFGLVSEYYNKEGALLAYHLDCYRLETEEEALDFGIEEYLDADCWVFIEWPERIDSLLPECRTEIYLNQQGLDKRGLTLKQLPL